MSEKELVSVVVPVYRVQKYLSECIDSILNQTYQNVEIILVDDGSPDDCPKICDEYAKKDKRIRVIHQLNAGVSVARNKGIELATGKYITFIDSDDYVDKNYIKKLYESLKGCSIAECGAICFDETGIKSYKKGKPIILDWKSYLTETNLNGFLSYACVWGKLYNRDLFKKIRFPIGRANGEDEATAFKLVYEGKNISRIYDPLYYYRQRNEGASQNHVSKKRIDDADFLFNEKINFFKTRNSDDMVAFFAAKKAMCFLGLYKRAIKQSDREECMKIIRNLLPVFMKEKIVPLKYKMYILVFLTSNKVRGK